MDHDLYHMWSTGFNVMRQEGLAKAHDATTWMILEAPLPDKLSRQNDHHRLWNSFFWYRTEIFNWFNDMNDRLKPEYTREDLEWQFNGSRLREEYRPLIMKVFDGKDIDLDMWMLVFLFNVTNHYVQL